MISLSLIGLIFLGYISLYFYNTSRALSIMVNAERLHNINYHIGLESFYRYLETNDTAYLNYGMTQLDSANLLAEEFGKSHELFQDKPVNEVARIFLSIAPQAYNYNYKNAKLLARRVNLLLKINNKQVGKSLGIAREGAHKGKQVKAFIMDYLRNPDGALLKQVLEANIQMNLFFDRFATVISQLNSFAHRVLVISIIGSFLTIGLLIFLISNIISGSISKPIGEIISISERIEKGDIDFQLEEVEGNDEISLLRKAFNNVVIHTRQIAETAVKIARGDFSQRLPQRSEKDILIQSLNKMSEDLEKMDIQNKRDIWLKSSLKEYNDYLKGDQELNTLAHNIIVNLAKISGAQMGVIYVKTEEKDELQLTGSYAFKRRKSLNNIVRYGEGIVGQVALEREPIYLTEAPEDYFKIESGLGNSLPGFIQVLPVLYNDQLMGVVELAFIHEPDKVKQEFIEQALEDTGIAIHSAMARTEMQKLLIKTQEQAEELMTQQEELRQTNEELEEQTKALRESEQQLQQQQEELRVANEELEERTKMLEEQRDDIKRKNEELKKATEEIERKARELEMASKYKSEFLANMSHELRTPLNSILVLSQILSSNKQGNLTEKQIQAAKTIYSSGNSLLSIINEVLDLSKVESGKIELVIEETPLKELIQEMDELFNPLAREKGISLECKLENNLPENIKTDAQRLKQIIRNLISNAIKFTHEGTVELSIYKPGKEAKFYNGKLNYKNSLAFKVKDTGIGIPADKQKVIFEAFCQVDGSTTRKYGGTGLGLTISKKFAELLGGEIHVYSEEGKGSEFILYLPLNTKQKNFSQEQETVVLENPTAPTAEQKPREKPVALKHDTRVMESYSETREDVALDEMNYESIKDDRKNISRGDKFILVIEDDPSFAKILYDLAHEKGFKCMIAPNGETGLHYADYYRPDAIILDIGLPGINGWEVLERLKENPNTRHIPVHFMSGSDKSIEAMKKGAIGFLRKPVSIEEIDEAFDNIENIVSRPLKKVLVVEDNEELRKSVKDLIEDKDVNVKTTDSGLEALEWLQKESFDCMILDLGLKDISGYDLLKKLGKNDDSRHMPIIIYTGKELTRDEENMLQQYSDRIIIKGIRSPERLLAETTLFLHRVESDLPEEKRKMLKKAQQQEDVIHDKKILIVDDDMRNVFALTSLLEERGAQVEVGRTGKEGLEKLEKVPDIDLVLMDIMMPEMNGYEAMETIRKNPKFKNLPIIALTAKAMQGDRDKCIKAGANDYLTKPIDTDKLISLLRVWLYK